MKKIVVGICVFCILQNLSSFAQSNVQTFQNQLQSLPYGQYLEYYSIDRNSLNMYFIELPDSQDKKFIKTLNDKDKENYKYVKKIQKLISKGNWVEVLYKYPDYFPAYVQYYNYCLKQNNFREALRILIQIQNMDKYGRIFRQEIVDYQLGTLYYNTGNFSRALDYFKVYESSDRDYIYSSMGNCYFYLGDYNKAIEYKNKMKAQTYMDKEIIYDSYIKMNNLEMANNKAKELLKEKYGFKNLMRLEQTSSNDEQKLSYAYKARNTAPTDMQIIEVNNLISNIEQRKLDKRISKLNQFVKVSKWEDIKKQFPVNVTPNEISAKQDEYFKTANMYLDKYTGQNLTNAFNSLNQDFFNYIQAKQNEYYKEQQLQAQAELALQQQMQNNYVRQQLIRQQKLRYYMDMDRMYYMRNSSYYNMIPGYYDMWW